MPAEIVVFSDLDGCLLNKNDYRFDDAIPCLERLAKAGIPVVLASSKTEPEMRRIAGELGLEQAKNEAPLICENGGAVLWGGTSEAVPDSEGRKTVLGAKREKIIEVLKSQKNEFSFQSFIDLGLEGVVAATDLPEEKAAQAMQRASTEPLLWQDVPDRIEAFRQALAQEKLTLTKGGRFWHVAGQTSKGKAMQFVMENWDALEASSTASLAIGDSPIDQSMLDVASYPVAIPQPDGVVLVHVKGENSRIAKRPGAAGWADSVSEILDELGVPA